MEELGDDSSLYLNIAYPALAENVFITSDGNTDAPGAQTAAGGVKKPPKKQSKESELKLSRDMAVETWLVVGSLITQVKCK